MKYSDQLLHPLWQKKRLEILERDEFMCKKCEDSETTLHVHHIEYSKNKLAWQYDNKYLDTLCKYCHLIIERSNKIFGIPYDEIYIQNMGIEINNNLLYCAKYSDSLTELILFNNGKIFLSNPIIFSDTKILSLNG